MKICIVTLGCKVNEYESEEIGKKLANMGFEVCFGFCYADFFVLNTCSITSQADSKSRQLIARVLKQNKDAKIVVIGCSSQNNKEVFLSHKNVVAVFGTKDKEKQVANYFAGIIPCGKKEKSLKTKTRKLVKISDGCNNFCAYCIVPFLRGRATSRTIEDIVQEIEKAKEKEVVLTAINLNNFEPSLEELLRRLSHVDKRIRLSSLEPQMVTKSLLEAYKRLKQPCGHFHLAVQSCCDNTLQQMGRKYTTKQILDSIDIIRQNFSNAFIACDIIVGFPEESDEHFAQTLEVVKKCKFSFMHVFPFSLRNGTRAQMLKQIDNKTITERANILGKLAKKQSEAYLDSQIGERCKMIVESKKGNFHVGHSINYIKCYFSGDAKQGEEINVIFKQKIFDGIKVDKLKE